MTNDLINALFEVGGACAALTNVITTYRAKQVRGVSMIATFWFSTWGFWNVYYYQSLGQTLSNYAAAIIALINLFWLGQMWYYRPKKETAYDKNLNHLKESWYSGEDKKSKICEDCGASVYRRTCSCQTQEEGKTCQCGR